MRKIFLFMMISLDGYFEGQNHDLSWHNVDEQFSDFAIAQLKTVDTILFGKTTYLMMSAYWSGDTAKKSDPKTAKLMNTTPKIVFSKSLPIAEWENTRVENNLKDVVKKLKFQPGKDIAVFGSSNLGVNLIEKGLLDELRIMINPVLIGSGTSLFTGLKVFPKLQLINTKSFRNGNTLLYYHIET